MDDVVLHTFAERSDLAIRRAQAGIWPEYNVHGDVVSRCWGPLEDELCDHQFVLHDERADTVVAAGFTGAICWDGDDASLPASFDEVIVQVLDARRTRGPVDTLVALAAEVPPSERGRGRASAVLDGMRELGQRLGLQRFVAPVRPSWKDRYPLIPVDQYVTWRRTDGLLLDPWMRIHERRGARVSRAMPQSLAITGTVAEWESWTGMAFPTTGTYTFPQGLAPLHVDREANRASYWEPNAWMVHQDLA